VGQQLGLSPEEAQQLADLVADVDFRPGSQESDAEAANGHSMAGRKPNGNQQTSCQAYQGTLKELARAVDSGDIPKALHIVQDAQSPSHEFQPWYGGVTSLHWPGLFHLVSDFSPM
jgi:hypothetical protein